MKKLIVVNGPNGFGKSAVCRSLKGVLNHSICLDGDWCWMMNPWIVNDENRAMVENNITYQLRSFLTNSTFEHVIFSWVLHREEILQGLLKRLDDLEFDTQTITLISSETALRQRMEQDHRPEEQILSSIERLCLYRNMGTTKIDTSTHGVDEVVEQMKLIISQ